MSGKGLGTGTWRNLVGGWSDRPDSVPTVGSSKAVIIDGQGMTFRESERLGSLKASLPRILRVYVAVFDWMRVVFSAKMGRFAPPFFHFTSSPLLV